MGLDMYLYRATKKNRDDLKHLSEVEDDLNRMWEPIIKNELPPDYWHLEDSAFNEHQLKLLNEMRDEFKRIEQHRRAIHDEMNGHTDTEEYNCGEIGYWRKFNALHNYIVDNFADGVDECQEIPLTKENVVQILDDLNKTIEILSTLNKIKSDDGHYYKYEVPEEIELPLIPRSGCFFGSLAIDECYENYVKRAVDVFSMIVREWNDDDMVWYQASW